MEKNVLQENGAAGYNDTAPESEESKNNRTAMENGATQGSDTAAEKQEEGAFRYDAFISYRHAPLDQYVAQTLQRRLESFKVPRLADKETKELGKKSIRRIFRDRDELPLAGNLSEPIMEALSTSENLIVICSPRILESQWCRREIETFIALRGMDHVFAVLIEGEPDEAFPEPLRVIKKEVVGEDGSVTVQEIPVEPLAADVRGASKAEVSKKIRQEMLRLAAPMLGCSYDDLRQRHKMRRLKRMLVSAAVIAGALFLFGTFSAYQAFRIKRQSDHIAAQSQEIMAQSQEILVQSEEIKTQSEEIQAQAQSLFAFQSRSLSQTALQLYESGDRRRALLVALEGIPEDLDHPDRPIVSQSEAALAEILQVYANGSEHRPYALFEHDAQTEVMAVSPSGTRLASVDSMGQLYCWDIREGTLLAKGQESVTTDFDITPVFLDDERLLYVGEDCVVCANSGDLSRQFTIPDLHIIAMAVSPDRSLFAIAQNRYEVGIYDAADGTLVALYEDGQQTETIGWDMTFSEDGSRVLFEGAYGDDAQNDSFESARQRDETRVISIDARTGAVLMEYEVPHRYLSSVTCTSDGVCYIIGIGSMTTGGAALEVRQSLTCFEADGRVRWEIDDRESKGGPVRLFGDAVVYRSGSDICMVSLADGSPVQELHYSSEVMRYSVNPESRLVAVTLADGTMQFDVMTDTGTVSRIYLESANEWMIDITSAKDTVIRQPRASNRIYLYRLAVGSNAREIAETGQVYYQSTTDGSNRLYIYDYEGYLVYDMRTDEVLYQYDAKAKDESIRGLCALDDYFVVITKTEVRVCDGATGEPIGACEQALYNWALAGETLYCTVYGGNFYKVELPSCQISEISQDFSPGEMLISGDGCFAVGYDNYQEDICVDLTSGETWELSTSCKLMAADENGETYLAADNETMQLARYRFGEREPIMQMDAQLAFIKKIGFSPDGMSFYVCYVDNRLEIYDADSFTLLQSYRDLDGVSDWKALGGGRTLLSGEKDSSADSYILDADYNVVYRIPRCRAVSAELGKVYTISGTTLYAYPLYDLEQLVQEARDVLGDADALTPEERRLYYIE